MGYAILVPLYRADTGTRGIPITPADIDLADIDGLGAADRLGLGRRDDDEVGPTA